MASGLLLLIFLFLSCHSQEAEFRSEKLKTENNEVENVVKTAPCFGCAEELDVNVPGLEKFVDVGLEHIDSENNNKYSLVKIIRIKREILANVKYTLVAEVGELECGEGDSKYLCSLNETVPKKVCSIEFYYSIINPPVVVGNNCTISQQYNPLLNRPQNVEREKDILMQRELSTQDLKELELQVIQKEDLYVTPNNFISSDPLFDLQVAEVQTKNQNDARSEENESNKRSSINVEDDDRDFNIYTDAATISRLERSTSPLEKVTSEERFFVKYLAEFAATTLDNLDDDNHRRVVLQILGAKKMVFEGTLYHLILRIGVSRCLEDEYDERCDEKLFENLTKICKVQVHVDEDHSNARVLKSQCQTIKKDDSDINRTTHNRFRRGTQLIGGFNDVDEESAQSLVESVLKQLAAQPGSKTRYTTLSIMSAKKQLVAGLLYKITAQIAPVSCNEEGKCETVQGAQPQECIFSIWDRPWLENGRHTNITCGSDENYYFEANVDLESLVNREKRQVGVEVNVTDETKIKELLEFTLAELASQRKTSLFKPLKINSATKQIVSGIIYKINATLEPMDSSENLRTCQFIIWEQPWLTKGRQMNVSCDNRDAHSFRAKRLIEKKRWVGNEMEVDSITINQLLHESLVKMDGEADNANKYKVLKVLSATKQVVSGLLYRIEAMIGFSDCSVNSAVEDTEECKILPDSETKICNFTIWNRPWLEKREISIECDKTDKIEKRDIHHQNKYEHFRQFKEFIAKYNKDYENEEFHRRFQIFQDNMAIAAYLNANEQGTARYGASPFADLTAHEFRRTHLGLRLDLANPNNIPHQNAVIPDIDIPQSFDWREKNAVTEVKDQGSCGSCWAFSVTGNVEGQYAIKYGKLLEFSEQELVDCDNTDDGCGGGLMDNAYRAIEKLGGLETESEYPYDGENEKCYFNKSLTIARLSGAINISQNEDDMAKWLIKNGPISIAINANAMQLYVGGVSHPFKFLCNPKSLDHGVLIVGYGVHKYPKFNKNLPYWIVKNSWGTRWGEQGYYRVFRGDGTCGVNQTPSSAIVE